MAPRIGPHILSQEIGGPLWRIRSLCIPGITFRATSIPVKTALPELIISRAFLLAGAMMFSESEFIL